MARSAVGFLLLGVVLFFIARNLKSVRFSIRDALTVWLIPATLMYAGFCVFSAAVLHFILREVKGYGIGMAASVWLFFASQQGKYIPGKFGNLLIKYRFLKEREAGLKTVTSVFLLEQGISILAGSLVVGTFFGLGALLDLRGVETVLLITPLHYGCLCLLGAASYILWRGFPSISKYLKVLIFYLAGWMLFTAGISFCIYGSCSSLNIGYSRSLELSWMYSASVIAGFISIITPAGLGVREGAFSYLISGRVADPDFLLVGVMIRSWMMIVELVLTGLSYLVFRNSVRIGTHGDGERGGG